MIDGWGLYRYGDSLATGYAVGLCGWLSVSPRGPFGVGHAV